MKKTLSFFRKKDTNSNAVEEHSIEGERSIPSVNKEASLQSRLTNSIGFIFIVVMGIFLLYQYYAKQIHNKNNAEETNKADQKTTQTSVQPLQTPPPPNEQPKSAVMAPPLDTNGQAQLTPEQLIAQRQQASPVFFKTENPTQNNNTNPQEVTGSSGSLGANTANNDALASNLRHTFTPGARAALLPDRNFLITKGTFFDCAMQTAIDTTVPGITTCMLSQDVYSDNGKVVLLERGTQFTGEQKSTLSLGQKRVFILWTRAKTPQGVVVDLDSPSTDSLGRAGVDGEIDNHFWDRFGAAIMLSLIQDGMAALVNNQRVSGGNGGNNTIVLPNTANNSAEVVSTILKQTVNIPPTLRKNQGGHINIVVARDLDFRTVYDLQVNKP